MNNFLFSIIPVLLLMSTMIFGGTSVQAAQSERVLPVYSTVYDTNRDPNDDGRDALKLARQTNRKVLIEVGGDWCSWCHIMDRFIKDHPNVESRLHETFVVLKVSIDEENDNAEFMSAFPPVKGYPHMYITDNRGNILYSQDTTIFWENDEYSEKRFMDFFDRWQNK